MTDPAGAEPAADHDPTHGLLVQAPIPPLDPNGTVVTTVGTALFAVAAIILFLLRSRLAAAEADWWLAVTVAGAVLGLIGIAYCWRRRGR